MSQVRSELREPIAALLPSCVSLEQWITERLSEEFVVDVDEAGREVVKDIISLVPKEERLALVEEREAAFFAALPEEELSEQEQRLRQALLDYLTEFGDGGPAGTALQDSAQGTQRFSRAGNPVLEVATHRDPRVYYAKHAFMPKNLHLRKWIEKRIGAEIEVFNEPDPSFRGRGGKYVFHYVGMLRRSDQALAEKPSLLPPPKKQRFD